MRIIRAGTAILAGLALAGCALGTAPPHPAPLTFSAEAAGHGEYLEHPEVRAAGEEGAIRVDARLSAPDPCQRVTGQASRSGREVTLHVRIERVGEACIAVIGTFAYRAVIGELAPGRYRLRVVHDYPGTGWPSGPVLEQEVEVR